MKKTAALSFVIFSVLLTSSFAFAGESSVINKTSGSIKSSSQKAASVVKNAAKKTAEGAKNAAVKTSDGAKNIFDTMQAPFKEVSADELQKQSSIKTLKNEKKALKSAYNSRIKDTKAKIKLLEKSSVFNDVQKQNKIYVYEKQILDLEQQRDAVVKKYDFRIKELKTAK